MADKDISTPLPALPNGSGAAAILSAGIGCFILAVLAFAADKSASFKSALIFYKPTGALSGDSILAIGVWLICWALLEARWRRQDVALKGVCWAAFALLGMSFLLTFPPIVDVL
jgi:hypothetical protein